MTMLKSTSTPDPAFRRQVCFRVGPDDWPLLEAAIRRHGGIQAALLAALRSHAATLLADEPADSSPYVRVAEAQAALPPPPAARGSQPPPAKKTGRRERAPRQWRPKGQLELNLAEAAPLLGVRPETLRRQIKTGRRPGRQGENGFWLARLDVSELNDRGYALTPRGAAEVLGVTAATVKRRCRAGRYPGARHGPEGWRVPLGDLV